MQVASDDAVKLQLVAALDAWVELEHALSKLFYVLLKPIPFHRAIIIFNSLQSSHAQRDAISALADDTIDDKTAREQLRRLLNHARSLATKRNRIVHGRWRHCAMKRRGREVTVLYRQYFPSSLALLQPPLSKMKGRFSFFIDDLGRCETEFRSLATAVDKGREIVAAALGVSPHIEIEVEGEQEFLDKLDQRSSPLGEDP